MLATLAHCCSPGDTTFSMRGRDGEQPPVGVVLADQHQADRRIAGAVARDRDRAAIEEIGDRRVAQHRGIGLAIGVVGLEIGERGATIGTVGITRAS